MTAGQEQTVRHKALPIPNESSELEVLSKKLHAEYRSKMPSAGRGKSPLRRAGVLRLHLKKAEKGLTQANQSGTGPGVGTLNRYPKEAPSQSKQEESNQPSRSPLTNELLDPGEELLGELDYEDVEETNPDPDQEIAQAVTHIPRRTRVLTWKCRMSDFFRVLNQKSPRPDTMSILSTQTKPNWAHLPRLRRVKTGCWMLRKVSPEHKLTAGQVSILTRPLTTKLPGHNFGPVSLQNQITIS